MAKHPVIGPEFDQHQRNASENCIAYAETLEYYRPRGFVKLARRMRSIARDLAKDDRRAPRNEDEWMRECDELLTAWARRVERHDYIVFGPFEHSGDVGFYYLVDRAMEDADLKIDAGGMVPRGFSGTIAEVTDHGNVTMVVYSRGRRVRELFAAV